MGLTISEVTLFIVSERSRQLMEVEHIDHGSFYRDMAEEV